MGESFVSAGVVSECLTSCAALGWLGAAPYNRLAFEYLEAGREVAMVTKTRSVSKSSVPRTASPGTSPYRFLVGNDPNPVLLTSLRSAGYSLVWKKEPR